jgi:HK97 family phage portal protein
VKSLLGGALTLTRRPPAPPVDLPPVPYAARRSDVAYPWSTPTGQEAQMRAMGAVGTLFAIVNRTSTAVAAVNWRLFRKAASGRAEDRVEVTRHAALDLLDNPNPFCTRQELFEVGQQHVDLTGEGWWVVARNPAAPLLPLELWPVRPDRMTPVPSPTDYLAGYVYTGPEGQRIPLARGDVIFVRMPNPLDPYRGMGPVQSILATLESNSAMIEWNRNFFRNSAEPGGIIEVEKRLSDDEFTEMNTRWAEQHRGVSNAHRVAVIEQGKWIDRNVSQRDMQFIEGLGVSKDLIREAFGMPKFAVGDVSDVNRATAEASKAWFAEQITVPRLERWQQALNSDLLPMFGPGAAGLEFDYDTPVTEDEAAENAELTAKSNAAKTFIEVGFTALSVVEALGLPATLVWEKPAPAPAQLLPPAQPPALSLAARLALQGRRRNAAHPDVDPADLPDVTPLQDDWEAALAALLADWAVLSAAQKDRLVDDVRAIAESQPLTALTGMAVDSKAAAAALAAAMADIAALAAARVVEEADAQGVAVKPHVPAQLELVAAVVAASLALGLVLSAVGAALRANGPAATPDDIAAAVRAALDDLTDAAPEQQLGGALTGAQNAGRIETLRLAPEGAIYANEKNDAKTCQPCKSVNGKWLGNISQMDMIEASYPGGAYGSYVHCRGRERCRGTVTGVWR